jgi:hypothetical protein
MNVKGQRGHVSCCSTGVLISIKNGYVSRFQFVWMAYIATWRKLLLAVQGMIIMEQEKNRNWGTDGLITER